MRCAVVTLKKSLFIIIALLFLFRRLEDSAENRSAKSRVRAY